MSCCQVDARRGSSPSLCESPSGPRARLACELISLKCFLSCRCCPCCWLSEGSCLNSLSLGRAVIPNCFTFPQYVKLTRLASRSFDFASLLPPRPERPDEFASREVGLYKYSSTSCDSPPED